MANVCPVSLQASEGSPWVLQPVPWTQQTSEVVHSCGQSCFEDSPNACPGGVGWLWGSAWHGGTSPGRWGAFLGSLAQRACLAGCGVGASPSPPGGLGVAPRARPPPSPPVPASASARSSGGPRGGSPSEERPLLADRRGMSSGGSRHVMRRRSSSSPSRGSNFQPPPWERRRAALAPPAAAGGCGRGRGGAEASDVSRSSGSPESECAGGARVVAQRATAGTLGPCGGRGVLPWEPGPPGLRLVRQDAPPGWRWLCRQLGGLLAGASVS